MSSVGSSCCFFLWKFSFSSLAGFGKDGTGNIFAPFDCCRWWLYFPGGGGGGGGAVLVQGP